MYISIFSSLQAKAFLSFTLSLALFFSQPQIAEAQEQNSSAEMVDTTAQNIPNEIPTDAQSIAHGRQLFGQHCTVCHMVEKQVIGPALASVQNRRPIPWLLQFIKNSQYVIGETDDEYAKQLYEAYNKVVMPAFEFLSDDDIISILAYIQAESASPTTAGGVSEIVQENTGSSQDGNDTYTQQAEEEINAPDPISGVSMIILVVFGVSFLAIVLAIFYIWKGAKKTKNNKNA